MPQLFEQKGSHTGVNAPGYANDDLFQKYEIFAKIRNPCNRRPVTTNQAGDSFLNMARILSLMVAFEMMGFAHIPILNR